MPKTEIQLCTLVSGKELLATLDKSPNDNYYIVQNAYYVTLENNIDGDDANKVGILMEPFQPFSDDLEYHLNKKLILCKSTPNKTLHDAYIGMLNESKQT